MANPSLNHRLLLRPAASSRCKNAALAIPEHSTALQRSALSPYTSEGIKFARKPIDLNYYMP